MTQQTQNENKITPKSLKIVSKMKTPKKKQNDKQEMDASDEDVIEHMNVDGGDAVGVGETPKWLKDLANKAALKKKDEIINPDKNIKKKTRASTGKWEKGLRDLRLKIANTYNLVKNYKDDMTKIPAMLGVTGKLTMKILKSLVIIVYFF